MSQSTFRNALGICRSALFWGATCLFFACSNRVDSNNTTICVAGNCAVRTTPKEAPQTAKAIPIPTPVPPMEPKKVLLKMREACHSCHGMGKDKSSFWQSPAEFERPTAAELEVLKAEAVAQKKTLPDIESLEAHLDIPGNVERIFTRMEVDQFSVEVFQTIENNLLNLENPTPKAMSPEMDAGTRVRFLALMDNLIAPPSLVGGEGAATTSVKAVAPLSLSEAKAWCAGCHSPGGSGSKVWAKANGSEADWKEFAAALRASVAAGRMPVGKFVGKERDEWLGVLAYFQRRMPMVVADARGKYHGQKLDLGVAVDVNYSCGKISTGRQFINDLTMNALNRPPTLFELSLVPNIEKPVSAQTRELLVARLQNQWKNEFIETGLKKFSEKVSSAEKVRNSLLISDFQLKEDIAGEFYQLVKAASSAGKSYKDIILSNQVYATKLTGPMYNETCKEKTKSLQVGQYVECNLTDNDSPRSTFFTTLGFLASKSSSMFQENNNYGRVAAMNEVIRGEPLRANTAGEKGETINPLPSCLSSQDWRVMLQGDSHAPRGTMSVPASGNFCQGCHVRRNLAAGAIAFRPFGPIGEFLTYEKIVALNSAERDDPNLQNHELALKGMISTSTAPASWALMSPENNGAKLPFSIDFYSSLLNIGDGPGKERGCIVDGAGAKEMSVTKVSDIVKHILTDDLVLARGLARIVPRALSNRNSTNAEVIDAITQAWSKNNGQLIPVLQAYFATNTYVCQSDLGGL